MFKNFSNFIGEKNRATESLQSRDSYPADATIYDILPSLKALGDEIDKLESKDPDWTLAISSIQKKFNDLESLIIKTDSKLGTFVG